MNLPIDIDDDPSAPATAPRTTLANPLAWLAEIGPGRRFSDDWKRHHGHSFFVPDNACWRLVRAHADAAAERLPIVPEAVVRRGRYLAKRGTTWTCAVRVGPLRIAGVVYRVNWYAPEPQNRTVELPAWLDGDADMTFLPGGMVLLWRLRHHLRFDLHRAAFGLTRRQHPGPVRIPRPMP